jgi:hypothetical protein
MMNPAVGASSGAREDRNTVASAGAAIVIWHWDMLVVLTFEVAAVPILLCANYRGRVAAMTDVRLYRNDGRPLWKR